LETRKRGKLLWGILGAFVALQVYLVRELLAALMMFTVVFAAFALLAAVAYALRAAVQRIAAFREPLLARKRGAELLGSSSVKDHSPIHVQ